MSALRSQVLGGYRRLLRARLIPFASDASALSSSRAELRTQFLANKAVADDAKIRELLKGVDDVEDMLLNGLVQGEVVDHAPNDRRVKVSIRKENAEVMNPAAPNPLEHLGEGLFPEEKEDLDEVVLDKSGDK